MFSWHLSSRTADDEPHRVWVSSEEACKAKARFMGTSNNTGRCSGGVSAAAQPMTSRAESGGSSEGGREAKADEREHRSSTSVPKADAWKEKNRLAQRAFRQRQKVHTCAPLWW